MKLKCKNLLFVIKSHKTDNGYELFIFISCISYENIINKNIFWRIFNVNLWTIEKKLFH